MEAEEALYVEVEEAVDVRSEDASGVEAEKDRRSKKQSDLWFQNDCEHSAVKIINISLYDYSSLLLVGITQQLLLYFFFLYKKATLSLSFSSYYYYFLLFLFHFLILRALLFFFYIILFLLLVLYYLTNNNYYYSFFYLLLLSLVRSAHGACILKLPQYNSWFCSLHGTALTKMSEVTDDVDSAKKQLCKNAIVSHSLLV